MTSIEYRPNRDCHFEGEISPSFKRPFKNEQYTDILQQLIKSETIFENEGVKVTEYTGGPLDLRRFGITDSWISPIKIEDITTESILDNTYIHMIRINCPVEKMPEARVIFNSAPEASIKLRDDNNPTVRKLRKILQNTPADQPTILIRISRVGTFETPEVIMPIAPISLETSEKHLNILSQILGKEIILSNLDKYMLTNDSFEPTFECEDVTIGKPTEIQTPVGVVNKYPVINCKDPWIYYEVFSKDGLFASNPETRTTLRIDSGCDSGQLYQDGGCDCSNQLMMALNDVAQNGGLIIHIPGQDGRGYGVITKMETEALKRGIPSVFNKDNPIPMETIPAAEKLFGEFFDSRTYDGVAYLLRLLGYKKIKLITDNDIKKNDLIEFTGLDVLVTKTNTLEDETLCSEARLQTASKHKHSMYHHENTGA